VTRDLLLLELYIPGRHETPFFRSGILLELILFASVLSFFAVVIDPSSGNRDRFKTD